MSKKLENNSIIYLFAKPLFLGIGFGKLLKLSMQDIWISGIIGIFIGLFINFIIKNRKNDNKVVNILCNLSMLGIIVMTVTKLISTLYLVNTPAYVISLSFILVSVYASFKDKKVLKQIIEILCIINLLLYLLNFFVLVPQIKIDYFLPIGTTNINNILKGSVIFALLSTVPYITIDNFNETYNYKMYIISSLFMVFVLIIVVGILGPNLALLYRYPEYIVLKRISILSFIENFENILYTIWIIDAFSFSSNACFNIIKNSNKWILCGLLGLMFSLNYILVLKDLVKTINFVNYYEYVIGILLLIWLITSKKNKPKEINP